MLMIERIAMTIHASLVDAPGPDNDPEWTTMSDDERARYYIAARRVLVAIRGPTHAMLADGNLRGAPTDAGNIWERMIFRALHEEGE